MSERRTHHARLVGAVAICAAVYVALLPWMSGSLANRIDSTWITVGILVVSLTVYAPLMARSGLPAATWGLTLRGWRRHVAQSLVWTTWFLAGLVALKLTALRVVPGWHDEPLFSLYGFTRYETVGEALMLMAIYACFVPAQELIARGALQSSLEALFSGRRRTVWAVALSSIVFGQVHLHLDATYAISVVAPSVFWGVMFARQRSLVGVSLSHAVIGIFVAFVLGLPTLEHAG